MNKYKFIVFDMDGTLYDLNDVISANYEMQCSFLSLEKGLTRSDVEDIFAKRHIYSTRRSDSKSCTEYFEEIGIDKSKWNLYRERNFPVDDISLKKSVDHQTLSMLASYHNLVLLTSNSINNVAAVLKHLGIPMSIFCSMICNNQNNLQGGFNKQKAFEYLLKQFEICPSEILSIGDRVETDIKPCCSLGGDGILLYEPKALKKIVSDLHNDNLKTCNDYVYLKGDKKWMY